jgi:hypothetical protein
LFLTLGYLESVLLSQRQEVRLTYSPPEDFLLSELTYSTGQLTAYLYDSLGRLDTVVLPAGKMLQTLLTGKTSSQGMQLRAVLRIRNKSFGSGSGLKLVSDPDSNLDPKRLFWFRIGSGSGQKFRILPDPDPSGFGSATLIEYVMTVVLCNKLFSSGKLFQAFVLLLNLNRVYLIRYHP